MVLHGQPELNHELQKHFDRFLKGKQNYREQTLRLNWSLLQFGDRKAIENVFIEYFPVANTDYKEFYLGQGKKLVDSPPTTLRKLSYDSEKHLGSPKPIHTSDKPTILPGLWYLDYACALRCWRTHVGQNGWSGKEFTSFSGPRSEHELNTGEHIIDSGPHYPSKIILSFVDVKV